jgi:hypothetical protein
MSYVIQMINWSRAIFRIPEHTCADFVLHHLPLVGIERMHEMHENVMALRRSFYFDG